MSSSDKQSINRFITDWFAGAQNIVIAGVGNQIRGDDFAGVEVIRRLKKKVPRSVYLIECDTVPESFIESIIRFNPSHILIIDVAILGLEPGFPKFVEPERTLTSPISTHTLPIDIFLEYLSKTTNARIGLLLIQPKNTDFGFGLTKEVEKTVEYLTLSLIKAVSK